MVSRLDAEALMLELSGVSKRYGAVVAVSGLSLSLPRGETTALIGPSGCGKSTLLRMMVGLVWPDEGAVRFDGAPLTRSTLPSARRRMGYVIQEGGLFPHLTARENLA